MARDPRTGALSFLRRLRPRTRSTCAVRRTAGRVIPATDARARNERGASPCLLSNPLPPKGDLHATVAPPVFSGGLARGRNHRLGAVLGELHRRQLLEADQSHRTAFSPDLGPDRVGGRARVLLRRRRLRPGWTEGRGGLLQEPELRQLLARRRTAGSARP